MSAPQMTNDIGEPRCMEVNDKGQQCMLLMKWHAGEDHEFFEVDDLAAAILGVAIVYLLVRPAARHSGVAAVINRASEAYTRMLRTLGG